MSSSEAYNLAVEMLQDLLVKVGIKPFDHSTEVQKTAGALVFKLNDHRSASALEMVRMWCADPCNDGCCDSCDGKNEAFEQVLHIINTAMTGEGEGR